MKQKGLVYILVKISDFENISLWKIITQMVCLGFLGMIISTIIQVILGVDWPFLMWLITNIFWLFVLLRPLQTNYISEEVIGEVSIKNIPWVAFISIRILLIIFAWLSQSVGASLLFILDPEVITEEIIPYLALENKDVIDLNLIMMSIISFTLVPIVEEFIFRGYLLNKLSINIGIWKATIISSLLFALFHFNILVFIAYFASGLFYGLVYLKTKKLLVPIILHALSNFVSALTSLLPGLGIRTIESLRQAAMTGTFIYVLLIPVVMFILYRLYKNISEKEEGNYIVRNTDCK